MADDAAAPEGELIEAPETATATPDGTTESPYAGDPDDIALVDDGLVVDDGAVDDGVVDDGVVVDDGDAGVVPAPRRGSRLRLAAALGLVVVLALAGLVGWLGWRAYQVHNAEQQRAEFIQVGRQAAVNLTTIDFEHADADVKRILDSATDQFYDDFSKRSQPFIDVVKQAQAKSAGEVTEAGLESQDGDSAQVLVTVTVKASNAGVPEQAPRYWRMRVTVKQVDNEVKVSNVGFVP